MAEPFPREKLQPSLLDRLNDDLASALGRLREGRAALARRLSPEQSATLERLLADERLDDRVLRAADLVPFQGLNQETTDLLHQVIELEAERRHELRRNVVLGIAELRTAVLRDLAQLLNTEQAEGLALEEDGATVPAFDGLRSCRDSVLNYGIPPLAGRVRTTDDYEVLARGIEAAIARFEPRLAKIKVRVASDEGVDTVKSPVTLIIEGELWGYPVSETLRVRTLLDLEEGKARIEGVEAA
jgi:type VI secretion system protein ImpF